MSEFFDILNSNGDYTDKVASRKDCHAKGYWHKAVVVAIVSSDNKKVLLQRRSSNKRMWPDLWDISSGGHVLTGELGYKAGIREAKEELGIDVKREEMEFIGATTSENIKGNIINRHFNEYYIVHKDVNLKNLIIQKEEIQDIKWFDVDEIIKMVNNNYDGITDKVELWNYIIKYFELETNNSNK